MAWKFFTSAGAEKRAPSSAINPMARATTAATQNVTNAAFLVLAFELEDYDTDTMHDLVTNNSRMTIQRTGTYFIRGQVTFPGNATGSVRQLQILKNGATVVQESRVPQNATAIPQFVTATVQATAGDYFELRCAQDSTTTPLALVLAAGFPPVFEITKLDGAFVNYVGVPGSLVGQELAYNETGATFSSTTATEAAPLDVLATSSITLDGVTPIIVEVFMPGVANGGAASSGFSLWEDTTDKGRLFDSNGAVVNAVHVSSKRRFTPSAGSHVYKIRLWTNGGTNMQVVPGVGGAGTRLPIFIRVTRAA